MQETIGREVYSLIIKMKKYILNVNKKRIAEELKKKAIQNFVLSS